MKNPFITALFLLPLMIHASHGVAQIEENNRQICQQTTEEDGYQGFLACTVRTSEESEKKLQSRLAILRKDLDGLSLKAYRANFEQDQRAWEVYKKRHCAYLSTGMENQAREVQATLCNVMENDKRLETLKDEPAFP
ncbi:lysozyme inhibitor LprI family protein [Erwinia mallotivora]|uniref:lysozyme inhibitor LprI family protein n=1 Tax=Erwinia mallotivora TaxID=69222 RepID=UPI0021C0C06A|nr:lysozyme inhibitor LprI family protein [Erwinia mallotivora]